MLICLQKKKLIRLILCEWIEAKDWNLEEWSYLNSCVHVCVTLATMESF